MEEGTITSFVTEELDPPINLSISQIGESQWLLGRQYICERCDSTRPQDSALQWTDKSGQAFSLRQTQSPPNATSIDPFYYAGTSAAVWEFAGLIWKVKSWIPGMETEAQTIDFVKEEFPSIPVPEVVYQWTEESINRSYTVMNRAPGKTLDSVWSSLSDLEHKEIALKIADYIALMATARRSTLETVSGYGVTDEFIQPEVEKPSWHPSLFRLTSGLQATRYFNPLKVDGDFLFTHGDISPGNILIDGGKISCILDWEFAGFYPKCWIYIKTRCPGMVLSDSEAEYSWMDHVDTELEKRGISADMDAFSEWYSKKNTALLTDVELDVQEFGSTAF